MLLLDGFDMRFDHVVAVLLGCFFNFSYYVFAMHLEWFWYYGSIVLSVCFGIFWSS